MGFNIKILEVFSYVAIITHQPVATLEDHRKGAMTYQVLGVVLEIPDNFHGLH